MTIQDIIKNRGITEVVHFTTYKGLLGILDAHAVKSRARLQFDQRVEYILKWNTHRVLDPGWEDFVNLSISRINAGLYNISSGKWHPDAWWCVLAFDPAIMTHDDVWFSTTNNAYPATIRGQGAVALNALFADLVLGRYSTPMTRSAAMAPNRTTCPQAEVVYPKQLSTDYLSKVYVSTPEHHDEVYAQMAGVGHPEVPVEISPEVFRA